MVIEKTVCEIILNSREHKVWKIVQHPDAELVGELASCGLPQAKLYAVGTKYTSFIETP